LPFTATESDREAARTPADDPGDLNVAPRQVGRAYGRGDADDIDRVAWKHAAQVDYVIGTDYAHGAIARHEPERLAT
jgi:hypothetical protein